MTVTSSRFNLIWIGIMANTCRLMLIEEYATFIHFTGQKRRFNHLTCAAFEQYLTILFGNKWFLCFTSITTFNLNIFIYSLPSSVETVSNSYCNNCEIQLFLSLLYLAHRVKKVNLFLFLSLYILLIMVHCTFIK